MTSSMYAVQPMPVSSDDDIGCRAFLDCLPLPELLGKLVYRQQEVVAMVTSLIFPFLVYQFGDGLQITFANALRGISDVKLMMVIAFIAYFVISLPVGYFCGFVMGWGIVGVWMAFPFGLTSCGTNALVAFPLHDKTPRTPPQNLILNT